MNRAEKETLVTSLRESLSSKDFMAVVKNNGLTVADLTKLRKEVGNLEGATYRVVKNTLMKLVVKDTDMAGLSESFVGPTAFASSDDYIGLAKVLVEFAQSNEKLVVQAAALQGKILSNKDVVELSKLPTYKEAMAQVVAMLRAPAMELHRVIDLIGKQESEQEEKGA
ncbi:MAG: 50S ribosomal protein L10 [Alphaproteobacteria bacterium]|nr:MAG: 50S ribosomal protein L10 [Alphaproteobacteria bacterium]